LVFAVIRQTQPIKMTWSHLRPFFTVIGNLGGGFKRENEMDVNIFSRYDHFMNQALNDGLAFLKRELIEIGTQQLAKALGMHNDLVPVDDALLCDAQLPRLLFKTLQFRREFLSARFQLRKVDDLGVKGVKQSLILTFDPLQDILKP
jgi:hypothetical protein